VHGGARIGFDGQRQPVPAQRQRSVDRDPAGIEGRLRDVFGRDDRRVAQRNDPVGDRFVVPQHGPAQRFGPAHRRQRHLDRQRFVHPQHARRRDEGMFGFRD
jgi:hypothetical protein